MAKGTPRRPHKRAKQFMRDQGKRNKAVRKEERRIAGLERQRGPHDETPNQAALYPTPADALDILIYSSRDSCEQLKEALSLQVPLYCAPDDLPSDPNSLDVLIVSSDSFVGDNRGLLLEQLREIEGPNIYLVQNRDDSHKELRPYSNAVYTLDSLLPLKAELNRLGGEKLSR